MYVSYLLKSQDIVAGKYLTVYMNIGLLIEYCARNSNLIFWLLDWFKIISTFYSCCDEKKYTGNSVSMRTIELIYKMDGHFVLGNISIVTCYWWFFFSGYQIDEKKVLGGEAALWAEYIDNENLISTLW